LAKIREARALARELSHPFSQANVALFASLLHLYRREYRAALEEAEALIALSREHGFLGHLGLGALHRAQALTLLGQLEEGIAGIRTVLDAMRTSGSEFGSSGSLAVLAQALGNAGQVKVGLAVLAEAQAFVARTGERHREAQLHAVKGDLLLALPTPDPARAEAAFREALEVARRQSARSRELGAATSLARLWQRQERKEEARELLSPIYDWFTEGFDTQDLKDAKVLLEELA
jgi:predicted ATPase